MGIGYLCIALTFVGLALISDSKLHKRFIEARQETTSETSHPDISNGTLKQHASGSSAPPQVSVPLKKIGSYKYKRFNPKTEDDAKKNQ